jgi:NAD(P)-dependent dehydrogenase (short-subunit alcohol dehydrogenase family)
MKPLAIVTGVGPGTGSAMVRRFCASYSVAMLARNRERLSALAAELPDTRPLPCDVSDPAALATALEEAEAWAGPPKVLIHNAVGGAFGNFLAIDPKVIERNFQVNVMALLHLARWAAPKMEAAGGGAIIATGNTSAVRGRANFAGFAPTKAAQRILLESIARDMGPKGIHASYLLIDAVIDVPWTRERYPEAPDDFFIQPADIAEEAWHIAHQPRSAWSFLTEVRPYRETW